MPGFPSPLGSCGRPWMGGGTPEAEPPLVLKSSWPALRRPTRCFRSTGAANSRLLHGLGDTVSSVPSDLTGQRDPVRNANPAVLQGHPSVPEPSEPEPLRKRPAADTARLPFRTIPVIIRAHPNGPAVHRPYRPAGTRGQIGERFRPGAPSRSGAASSLARRHHRVTPPSRGFSRADAAHEQKGPDAMRPALFDCFSRSPEHRRAGKPAWPALEMPDVPYRLA